MVFVVRKAEAAAYKSKDFIVNNNRFKKERKKIDWTRNGNGWLVR